LKKLATSDDLTFSMANFPGPLVLIPYGNEPDKQTASALCVRYSDAPDDIKSNVLCINNNLSESIISTAVAKEDCERWII
jgi:tRNA-specific 2-thiouridylase